MELTKDLYDLVINGGSSIMLWASIKSSEFDRIKDMGFPPPIIDYFKTFMLYKISIIPDMYDRSLRITSDICNGGGNKDIRIYDSVLGLSTFGSFDQFWDIINGVSHKTMKYLNDFYTGQMDRHGFEPLYNTKNAYGDINNLTEIHFYIDAPLEAKAIDFLKEEKEYNEKPYAPVEMLTYALTSANPYDKNIQVSLDNIMRDINRRINEFINQDKLFTVEIKWFTMSSGDEPLEVVSIVDTAAVFGCAIMVGFVSMWGEDNKQIVEPTMKYYHDDLSKNIAKDLANNIYAALEFIYKVGNGPINVRVKIGEKEEDFWDYV